MGILQAIAAERWNAKRLAAGLAVRCTPGERIFGLVLLATLGTTELHDEFSSDSMGSDSMGIDLLNEPTGMFRPDHRRFEALNLAKLILLNFGNFSLF